MTTHVMLDLETWGKRPGCDIRSIGAVVFDPVAGRVTDDTFYVACRNPIVAPSRNDILNANDSARRKYTLHRDPETVKWWNDQSPEAQAAFENPVDLRVALERFTSWVINMYPGGWDGNVTPDIKLWANDPHFDVSILAEAYHAVGLPVPWHYRAPRSMRTVVDLSGLTRDEYVAHGTAHNALDDAIAQAMTVCKCYERLGLVK